MGEGATEGVVAEAARARGAANLHANRARAVALEALANDRFDVLIVGGGIVGAGALLDAASRGLRAALVEQDDIASGTSGRSSRLIHGGLRYLEQLQFGLVAEALEERSRLLRLAPHLVRLEPFLFPIYGIPFVHQAFYGAGIFLYDLLGAHRDGGFSRHLRPGGALEFAPQLRREGLAGGIVYHDGVEDDARLALTVVRTALSLQVGAVAATRVRAEVPTLEAGRIAGATVRDLEGGRTFEVRAERVIDATGVWASRADERFAPQPEEASRLVPSRGSHIVIRRDRLSAAGGMTLRIPGRVVFIIPWSDHWIIGTTDHLDDRPPDHLSAPNADVDELLDTVNRQTHLDLSRADIVGTYAGLRPLIGGSGDSTVKTSREHKVTTDASGVVRIGGGKYTTYRVMARDVVDAALGRARARQRPSQTAELSLLGAAAPADLDRLAGSLDGSVATLDGGAAGRLVARHGTEASAVLGLGRDLALVAGDGRPQTLVGSHLAAEVSWAARHELARSIDDVLSRRMRLAQVMPDRGATIAARAAELLGAELGWDAARQRDEVASYVAGAIAEYGVPWPDG